MEALIFVGLVFLVVGFVVFQRDPLWGVQETGLREMHKAGIGIAIFGIVLLLIGVVATFLS